MPSYKYRALDTNHNVIENIINTENIHEVYQVISEKGLIPIRIEEVKGFKNFDISFSKKIKLQDIVIFCRELAIIIRSGVNLVLGLEILKKQSDNYLKESIQNINLEVQKGRTLAQAMKETEQKFPSLLVKMISTGESSGNVDTVLENMADYYEREVYIKQKIKAAIIYPIILIVMAIILLIFFAHFILPALSELLAGQELPFITKFTIGMANFVVSKYMLVFIFLLTVVIVFAKKIIPIEKYRRYKDLIILKTPIIGSVTKNFIIIRFVRTLYLLTKSGLDIVRILEILKSSISNSIAEQAIDDALEGIKRGENLGTMLGKSSFFEPLLIQMITVGEETGEFEKILEEITKFYERKLEAKIDKMVSMMEPVFTIVIGGFIAFIIISLAYPIFNMASGIQTPGSGFYVE